MVNRHSLTAMAASMAILAALAPHVSASPADVAKCDELAALPNDPDNPPDIKGRRDIPPREVAAALAACKAAAATAGAPPRTLFELGRAYEFNRQPAEAAKAYRRAVDAGSSTAMVGLGTLYATGKGVARNPAETRKLFTRAAEAGNPIGMSNLGSLYGAGLGVRVDFAMARSWYAKAAALNDAEAMFQLGLMTEDGDGGPKDDAAAKAWFEKAAALDHAGALGQLGVYAEAGRAGPKDQEAAIAFYKRAAALGDEDAADALKRLRCPFVLKDKSGKPAGNICFDDGN
jgi:TPR repeat protein